MHTSVSKVIQIVILILVEIQISCGGGCEVHSQDDCSRRPAFGQYKCCWISIIKNGEETGYCDTQYSGLYEADVYKQKLKQLASLGITNIEGLNVTCSDVETAGGIGYDCSRETTFNSCSKKNFHSEDFKCCWLELTTIFGKTQYCGVYDIDDKEDDVILLEEQRAKKWGADLKEVQGLCFQPMVDKGLYIKINPYFYSIFCLILFIFI